MVEGSEAVRHRPPLRSRHAAAQESSRLFGRIIGWIARVIVLVLYLAALLQVMAWLAEMHICARGDNDACDRLLQSEVNQ